MPTLQLNNQGAYAPRSPLETFCSLFSSTFRETDYVYFVSIVSEAQFAVSALKAWTLFPTWAITISCVIETLGSALASSGSVSQMPFLPLNA